MSNALAIATVTAALRRRLQAAVAGDLAGTSITTGRPDPPASAPGGPAIHLFLYQVVPHPALRNQDLPTRTSDGRLLARPQAALQLHYLITFHGDAATLEPERLMGAVIQSLHAQPVLGRKLVLDAIRDPSFPFLGASDLAQQLEPIRLQPLSLDTEELFRLWSAFQTRFALSLAYAASVVLIEGAALPEAALPVRALRLDVESLRRPLIEQLLCVSPGSEEALPAPSATVGDELVILGRALRGEALAPDVETLVRVGELVLPPASDGAREGELLVRLADAARLRAGLQGVQVVHARRREGGLRPLAESNVRPLELRPRIVSLRSGGPPGAPELTLGLAPRLGRGQRVLVLLNQLLGPDAPPGTRAASQALLVPPPTADTDELRVPLGELGAGSYLVRVQVDGVASLPTSDAQGRYEGPQVTVP